MSMFDVLFLFTTSRMERFQNKNCFQNKSPLKQNRKRAKNKNEYNNNNDTRNALIKKDRKSNRIVALKSKIKSNRGFGES